MTGDKPDPRLRTPMQWSRAPGVGYTRGLAWEPLHPDSLTANVEVQDGDPNSLLNRYRLLIHLRGQNPALSAGELLPLAASTDAVAAYLRRAGDRAVLVVANLGADSLSGVTISSEGSVLPTGRYAPRSLLDGASRAPLQVGENGRIEGYLPLPSLGPMQSHLFELAEVDR